jgi:hypothetical protein
MESLYAEEDCSKNDQFLLSLFLFDRRFSAFRKQGEHKRRNRDRPTQIIPVPLNRPQVLGE